MAKRDPLLKGIKDEGVLALVEKWRKATELESELEELNKNTTLTHDGEAVKKAGECEAEIRRALAVYVEWTGGEYPSVQDCLDHYRRHHGGNAF
jgi:uncharacterized protein YpbB